MRIKVHRKEQYDLECWPWVCVHVERTNARGNPESKRVFCVWSRGLQIGDKLWLRRKPGFKVAGHYRYGRGVRP